MNKFLEIFQDLVLKSLTQAYEFSARFGPRILWSAIILFIGWVCALLIKKISAKLLKGLGFDVFAQKTGLRRFLEKGGIKKAPSLLVGLIFYWIIIFSALIMVFNTLELLIASWFIQEIFQFGPKIMIAVILLALGVFLGQFANKFAQASCRIAGVPFPKILGGIFYGAIVALALITALEYLGVSAAIITQIFLLVFVVIPLVLCLIFVIAGRDILSSILAGRFLIRELKAGESVEFDSVSGAIQSIDLLTTKIISKQEEIIVPNSELAKKIIKRKGGK